MNPIEFAGWAAAAFTLAAFSMKTMVPLRIAAILANVCFIVYGYLADLPQVLFLHLVLFPFNLWRLAELHSLLRRFRASRTANFSPEWLMSAMRSKHYRKGDFVFRKGDRADYLYYLSSGTVRLVEIDKELQKGVVFGEVAFFNESKTRTLSIVCQTDCEVMAIDEKGLLELYYKKPEFGFFLVKLLAQRVSDYADPSESSMANATLSNGMRPDHTTSANQAE